MNLPQQVKVGQQYSFDAIVQEPLGDYLVGAAIEEPIQADKYFNPTVELELLPAGGLFKVGRAQIYQLIAGFLPFWYVGRASQS